MWVGFYLLLFYFSFLFNLSFKWKIGPGSCKVTSLANVDNNYMHVNGSGGKLHVLLHCVEYEDVEAMEAETSMKHGGNLEEELFSSLEKS